MATTITNHPKRPEPKAVASAIEALAAAITKLADALNDLPRTGGLLGGLSVYHHGIQQNYQPSQLTPARFPGQTT